MDQRIEIAVSATYSTNPPSASEPPIRPGRARATATATTAPEASTRAISTVVERSSRSPPPAAKAVAAKAAPRSALAAKEATRGTGQRGQVAPRSRGPAGCAQRSHRDDRQQQRERKPVGGPRHVVETVRRGDDRLAAHRDGGPPVAQAVDRAAERGNRGMGARRSGGRGGAAASAVATTAGTPAGGAAGARAAATVGECGLDHPGAVRVLLDVGREVIGGVAQILGAVVVVELAVLRAVPDNVLVAGRSRAGKRQRGESGCERRDFQDPVHGCEGRSYQPGPPRPAPTARSAA